MAVMAASAAQTSREMPAKISFLRPVAVIAWATVGWLNALTDERSMIGTPGNASTSFGGAFGAAGGVVSGAANMLTGALAASACAAGYYYCNGYCYPRR